jgi:hypothetical protein
MRRLIIITVLAVSPVFTQLVYAQEAPRTGRIEFGAFPVGAVVFTRSEHAQEPEFGNFALGATLTLRVNRWIGLEGEIGNAVGVHQRLALGSGSVDARSPNLYAYNANLVVNPLRAGTAIVPYIAGGVGGLTLEASDHAARLGISLGVTYLAGNAGGGTKWYFNDRWGVRADYRLLIVRAAAEAPEFFGKAGVRYGHRAYGGLLFSY